jgi:RNA polymerase sigma-54 factor
MAMMPKLELRQGQSLVMTPQLQQAIKLLQMSNLELSEFVETELEQNPLLEHIGNREQPEPPVVERADSAEENAADLSDTLSDDNASTEALTQLDGGYENVYGDESRVERSERVAEIPSPGMSSMAPSAPAGSSQSVDFEAILPHQITLSDHLRAQLNIALSDPAQRIIGRHLIGMLNDDGYLHGDLNQAATTLGADSALIENTLSQLQTFEPSGVFARDLQECLRIQLQEKDRFDPVMERLLNHLDLLAKRDYEKLMELCDADRGDLIQMIEDIHACNPRPGSEFGALVVQPVIPDVFVREAPDGTWLVELNSETLPRVLVNNQYHASVSLKASREEDKEYISNCLTTANWLVKSLDQRAKTILKVAREIVRQQDGFLVHGVQHLRPLTLREVADAIEMHESTVSRVTSNKYMATLRGIVELKYFFTPAIASSQGGEAHSSEAVRQRIKDLIENEAPQKILSDDKIVTLLRDSGIDIARRTVAKYREALGFGSSVQRRREKKTYA